MGNIRFVLMVSCFLFLFVPSQAAALPVEYSITGTASYWSPANDQVFSNQSIGGSFVLSDPDRIPHPDNGHYNFGLSDMFIYGDGFELSGFGNIHILYPGVPYPTESDWGEPDMDMDLESYIAREGSYIGWQYQSFFYNEDGSIDLSFSDDPYRINFYGSLWHATNGDRYSISVSAIREASVPEPATMLLLSSFLIGFLFLNRRSMSIMRFYT